MKITDFENSLRVKFFNESGLKAYDGHIMDGDEVVWREQYVKWLENLVKNNCVLDDVISCLPTDVEISDYSKQKYLYRKSPCGTYYEGKQKGFYEGAEWIKDKLNNL